MDNTFTRKDIQRLLDIALFEDNPRIYDMIATAIHVAAFKTNITSITPDEADDLNELVEYLES